LGKIIEKIKRIYRVVLQAQQLAISAVRAGVKICQIDNIARKYIVKAGLGSCFGHALGHGIGREVHEYPSISPKNYDVLQEGMVFTIEPGVYISGIGGIRIEDMVLVTKTGCEVLTK
jgi:Xaa-Pro aminopeptidase